MVTSNVAHRLSMPHSAEKRASNPSVIERLMRDSADGVDVSHHLPALRQTILLDGVEADESGMVSVNDSHHRNLGNSSPHKDQSLNPNPALTALSPPTASTSG